MFDFSIYLFMIANIGIFLGYLFVSFLIMPSFPVRLKRTRIGGALFFLSCGLTHSELFFHALSRSAIDLAEMGSWHMVGLHLIQVIAVFMFIQGLYVEFRYVKDVVLLNKDVADALQEVENLKAKFLTRE